MKPVRSYCRIRKPTALYPHRVSSIVPFNTCTSYYETRSSYRISAAARAPPMSSRYQCHASVAPSDYPLAPGLPMTPHAGGRSSMASFHLPPQIWVSLMHQSRQRGVYHGRPAPKNHLVRPVLTLVVWSPVVKIGTIYRMVKERRCRTQLLRRRGRHGPQSRLIRKDGAVYRDLQSIFGVRLIKPSIFTRHLCQPIELLFMLSFSSPPQQIPQYAYSWLSSNVRGETRQAIFERLLPIKRIYVLMFHIRKPYFCLGYHRTQV